MLRSGSRDEGMTHRRLARYVVGGARASSTVNMAAAASHRCTQRTSRLLCFLPFLFITLVLNGANAAPETGLWTIPVLNVSVKRVFHQK